MIDDLEWKNPIDFGENRKTKMAGKYDEKACALHNLIKNTPINFIFDVVTDRPTIEVDPYRFLKKIGIQKGRWRPF